VADHHAVGRHFERVREAGIPIAHEVGVHPNDDLFSFYVRSPSGFQTEMGAEGRLVDGPEPVLTYRGMARWGHRMPLGEKIHMLPLVAQAAWRQFRERLGR